MNIKIGDKFEHGEMEFVVTKIDMMENLKAKAIYIQAVDPDTADSQQQHSIQHDNVQENIMGLLNKLMGGGRGLGGGFGHGGE